MNFELDSEDFQGFEDRTRLPSRGSRVNLEALGARYFSTPPFEFNGVQTRYEQMQGQMGEGVYMWKRLVEHTDLSDSKPFIIHLEISPQVGAIRYRTPAEERTKSPQTKVA